MPYQGAVGEYRGRQRGFSAADAIRYMRQAAQMKKEYDKAKAQAKPKARAKTRAKRGRPVGSKNKP